MKKLETILKNFDQMSKEDLLAEIIGNENVDAENLTDREKFAVLLFAELAKAINKKDLSIVLDCNYAKSNKHNKSEKQLAKGQQPEYLVDYYRVINNDSGNSLIQVYCSCNPNNGKVKFDCCTSAAKLNLMQFEAMEDELHFVPKKDKQGKAKTSTRTNIPYEEIVDVIKSVVAVLASTAEEARKDEEEEEVA